MVVFGVEEYGIAVEVVKVKDVVSVEEEEKEEDVEDEEEGKVDDWVVGEVDEEDDVDVDKSIVLVESSSVPVHPSSSGETVVKLPPSSLDVFCCAPSSSALSHGSSTHFDFRSESRKEPEGHTLLSHVNAHVPCTILTRCLPLLLSKQLPEAAVEEEATDAVVTVSSARASPDAACSDIASFSLSLADKGDNVHEDTIKLKSTTKSVLVKSLKNFPIITKCSSATVLINCRSNAQHKGNPSHLRSFHRLVFF
jgi:hypothetical protein